MYRHRLRRVLPLAVATAVLAATTAAAPAHAEPAEVRLDGPGPTNQVATTLDTLARTVARSLDTRPDVLSTVVQRPVDLAAVAAGTGLGHTVETATQRVLRAKGLPDTDDPVLQLRLANPATGPALAAGAAPVVAAAPTDDTVDTVTGYDPDGNPVALDASRTPQRPVLLVEVDLATTMPMGLAVLRQELAAHGLTAAAGNPAGQVDSSTQSGYWATKMTAVRLSDVKEPWFKGSAEIFSVVGGFDLDGNATVDIVDMPYLDDEDTTYYPNQLVVHYVDYKYDLADIVMMEDDGDTNYQDLAQALITALLTVTDQGMYIPLVGPILDAMPDSWWTDDPDYVDSWYTLATTSNGRLYGAAGNGWMDVTPYWVSEL